MPRRSSITQLPPELKAWLDQELPRRHFSGYEELAALLAEKGVDIGKSSLHRYGQGLQRRIAAIKASTEAAAAIAEAAPDDEGARSAAVISLVQTDLFNVLLDLQEAEDLDPVTRTKLLARAARSIAQASRADIHVKRYANEVRAKVQAAAQAAEKIARKGGLTARAVNEIRSAILGIDNRP